MLTVLLEYIDLLVLLFYIFGSAKSLQVSIFYIRRLTQNLMKSTDSCHQFAVYVNIIILKCSWIICALKCKLSTTLQETVKTNYEIFKFQNGSKFVC